MDDAYGFELENQGTALTVNTHAKRFEWRKQDTSHLVVLMWLKVRGI